MKDYTTNLHNPLQTDISKCIIHTTGGADNARQRDSPKAAAREEKKMTAKQHTEIERQLQIDQTEMEVKSKELRDAITKILDRWEANKNWGTCKAYDYAEMQAQDTLKMVVKRIRQLNGMTI